MKRNRALLLIIAVAGFVQMSALAQKPAAAASTPTVKVVPAAPAKPSPAGVKVIAVPTKPAVVSVQTSVSKPGAAAAKPDTKPASVTVQPKSVPVAEKKQNAAATSKPMIHAVKNASATKDKSSAAHSSGAVTVQVGAKTKSKAVEEKKATSDAKKETEKPASAGGRRDPFISPVVKMGAVGSGCSSGKRCLAIDQIALKGIVKSDTGMIAVVVNSMAKAYFLRENDPVFNGYVLKITGDSIVFKESFRDRLGKPLTRDVTKTIIRPVA
jgi:hypothetical protein